MVNVVGMLKYERATLKEDGWMQSHEKSSVFLLLTFAAISFFPKYLSHIKEG